tara:strand:- start:8944 stop:9936 length:993 start_codon:yes stop_codon:yes gene_type:complete
MKNKFVLILFLFISCDNNSGFDNEKRLTFIASEGNFGSSNASISVFQGPKQIQKVSNIGDVIQSIKVYDDKLFVLINNSHLIKIYIITSSGLSLPGIKINTHNSGPREMVIVDDYLYFTNWNSRNIKILNLETYFIEDSISVNGTPEGIVSDGSYLWVAISSGSTVEKIDINSKQIVETFQVGNGPQQMLIEGSLLWISRTYYSPDWSEIYYGTSQIDILSGAIQIKEYDTGIVCGGDMMKINEQTYRTYEGGVAPLKSDLTINRPAKIGSYNTNSLYSAGAHSDYIFMGTTSDFNGPDTVYIHNELGKHNFTYIVDASPGDYAIWEVSN